MRRQITKVTNFHLYLPELDLGDGVYLKRSNSNIGSPSMAKDDHFSAWVATSHRSNVGLKWLTPLLQSDVCIVSDFERSDEDPFVVDRAEVIFAISIFFDNYFCAGIPAVIDEDGKNVSVNPEIDVFFGDKTRKNWLSEGEKDGFLKTIEYVRRCLRSRDPSNKGFLQIFLLAHVLSEDSHLQGSICGYGRSIFLNHAVETTHYAYMLIESELERRERESWSSAALRWVDATGGIINSDEVEFIVNKRNLFLHFNADKARSKLKELREKLSLSSDFSQDFDFMRSASCRVSREIIRSRVRRWG